MAHFTLEYSANLKAQFNVSELLRKVNEALLGQQGVFPPAGIRSRAIELVDYRMADGAADYAFVHATLKIGAGRTAQVRRSAGEAVFDVIKEHFAELYSQRYLALSMELQEFDEGGTYKHNNVHARFR